MRQTTAHGISFLEAGSRNSRTGLICIHGWACQATDYTYLFKVLQPLDPTDRLIAIDLPGHGHSSTTSCPDGSLTSMVDAILETIMGLDMREIVLIGHSMGMRVALECWYRATTSNAVNVKALVLLDGSHYKLRKSLFAFDSGDFRSKTLSPQEKLAGMEAAFRRMFCDHTPEEIQTTAIAHLGQMDFDYSDRMRKSFLKYDYERMDAVLAELGSSGLPVLSLQSTSVDDQNQRTPLRLGETSPWMAFLQAQVPQAQILTVEDCMHFPHVDQSNEVAQRIHDFLETIDF